MKNEELIINGTRVDMSPDTRIVLNFKSNLLNDISKITSSNSQTISLPKTVHNRAVFDNPTAPSYPSTSRYRRMSAEYIRNGVCVVSGAYAVLLDSGENYEIGLYWGEMTKFQSWIDNAPSIKDLDITNTFTLSWAYALSSYPPTGNGVLRANYHCGAGNYNSTPAAAKTSVALHPVVPVKMILDKIQSDNGITFDFPSDISSKFKYLGVACTTKRTTLAPRSLAEIERATKKSATLGRALGIYITAPTSGFYTVEDGTGQAVAGEIGCSVISVVSSGKMRISYSFAIDVDVEKDQYLSFVNPFIRIGKAVIFPSGKQKIDSGWSGLPWQYSYWHFDFYGTLNIDCVAGDKLPIFAEIQSTVGNFWTPSNWDYPIIGSFYFTPPAGETDAAVGESIPIKLNLPDIKQVDFVKAISAMFGLSVIPTTSATTLKFIPLETIAANKSNAVDWSSKLIRSNDDEPERVKFTIGDFAKRNRFKYKEDKTVAASGDAEILVDNETLEPERDVITLPFAASDEETIDNKPYAKIPIYKTNDAGEWETQNLEPRIVQIVSDENNNGKCKARFNPISFGELLAGYYGELQRLLNNAVVIVEKIRLNEADIKTLDYTKPVFLKQYGRYYAIVSIQTAEGYCKVELMQFPWAVPTTPRIYYRLDDREEWFAGFPASWEGHLHVRTTPGGQITNDDIIQMCSAALIQYHTPTVNIADFSLVKFEGDAIGEINIQLDPDDDESYSLYGVEKFICPDGIKGIGRLAFYYAVNTHWVVFPESLEYIGRQAFKYAYGLYELNIPASVTYIGEDAFAWCSYLTRIICRAATPPEAQISSFHGCGEYGGTDRRLYVPDGKEQDYANAAGWSRLVDEFGFTIYPLSQLQ